MLVLQSINLAVWRALQILEGLYRISYIFEYDDSFFKPCAEPFHLVLKCVDTIRMTNVALQWRGLA